MKGLAQGADRAEADRARALLLTLEGWTSTRIAQAFGVREDRVRLWRSDFSRGGACALRARIAAGPVPVKAEAALRVAVPLLSAPVEDRRNGTLSRRAGGIARREGLCISRLQLSKVLRKRGGSVPRPRHSLKGRPCGEEVDRISLRLAFRKAQAATGDIVLLFAGESEALTHPCPARAWARRGADLRVSAPGQARKVAGMGALDRCHCRLIVATSKTRRSADFAAFLEDLDHPCGPKPGQPQNPVVLVQGNGPIHTGKATKAALTARAHWLRIKWLPKYAPELNDIETVWRDLKAHHLAHQTFTDTEALDQTIHEAVEALNVERKPNPLANQRISA